MRDKRETPKGEKVSRDKESSQDLIRVVGPQLNGTKYDKKFDDMEERTGDTFKFEAGKKNLGFRYNTLEHKKLLYATFLVYNKRLAKQYFMSTGKKKVRAVDDVMIRENPSRLEMGLMEKMCRETLLETTEDRKSTRLNSSHYS